MKKRADWKILTACIVVAIIFWLLNEMGRDYRVEVDYPIKVQLSSKLKKRKLSPKIPKTIKLQVYNKGWDLLKFNITKIKPIIFNIKRSRTWYITRNDLTKAAKLQVKYLKVEKVITRSIKLY